MSEHSTVEFIGDYVHKTFQNDVVAQFTKARLLWELSKRSGFVFPEPVALHEADNLIISRNLNVYGSFASIRDAYLRYMIDPEEDTEAGEAIRSAGRVLGVIHRELELPETEPWHPSPDYLAGLSRMGLNGDAPLDDDTSQVCLHGDYGFSNVFYSPESGMIATLDPSADEYSTFVVSLRGPRYVDLGQFSSCLEGRLPIRWYPRIKWRRLEGIRTSFLDGYEETSGVTVDRDCVRRFGFATAEAHSRALKRSRPLHLLARVFLFNAVKGNTPSRIR